VTYEELTSILDAAGVPWLRGRRDTGTTVTPDPASRVAELIRQRDAARWFAKWWRAAARVHRTMRRAAVASMREVTAALDSAGVVEFEPIAGRDASRWYMPHRRVAMLAAERDALRRRAEAIEAAVRDFVDASDCTTRTYTEAEAGDGPMNDRWRALCAKASDRESKALAVMEALVRDE